MWRKKEKGSRDEKDGEGEGEWVGGDRA